MVGLPNRDRRAERREATRQEILAAAWEVARAKGIAGLTLREVAVRIGMQPPSLYSHFDSKHAIYDAMFAQGWQQLIDVMAAAEAGAPREPWRRLDYFTRVFIDFALAEPSRNQLMNVRVIPDFTPSAESYAVAVEAFDQMRGRLREIGVTRDRDIDLFTALIAGLVAQQEANDQGGDRWRRLIPDALGMFSEAVGITGRTTGRKR
ncbi:MAG TPA: TetR/AcrR family transcriptional regulator [Jatrophihabitans sp.]|jgi:AcrR family transcriptional regulator